MLERRVHRAVRQIVLPEIGKGLTQVTVELIIRAPERGIFKKAESASSLGAHPIRHSVPTECDTKQVLMEVDDEEKSFAGKELDVMEKIPKIPLVIFRLFRVAVRLE